jgi:hypothetical protein
MNLAEHNNGINTPVCLIVFRRPDHTRKLLDALSIVRPRRLFVVADGPRPHHDGDLLACLETRRLIDDIDWPCDVRKNYSDSNLGCGIRPSSGISWLFEHVNEAVILEDDCIPDPSFFTFCEELLSRYRDDPRVMQICGSTYQRNELPTPCSYFFSESPGCWGWATWKRAWLHYDATVRSWPSAKAGGLLEKAMGRSRLVGEYAKALDHAHAVGGKCSYWDYQWGLACILSSGLSIYPKYNLISNVGFGEDATHTRDIHSRTACIPQQPMPFPLIHPQEVAVDWKMKDYYTRVDNYENLVRLWRNRIYSAITRIVKMVAQFQVPKSTKVKNQCALNPK